VDYVALGLDALTTQPARHPVTGAIVPVEGGLSPFALMGATIVGALAVLGIGAALAPTEEKRVKALSGWGYDPYAPAPLVRTLDKVQKTAASSKWGLSVKKLHRNLDEEMIREALQATNGNKTHAAKMLDRSRRWLLYKLKEYDIKASRVAQAPQLDLFKQQQIARATAARAAPPAPPVFRAEPVFSAAPPVEQVEQIATVAAAQAIEDTAALAEPKKKRSRKAAPPKLVFEAPVEVDLTAPLFPVGDK
jgi:hypothetical protein